ncbi:16S rRNA (cytosine(1402)-N(4))-methyltransferase RsmH [Halorhodospira halochloris]|uniref:16S rRNA (cytosine(1402)-N(4))-methyltransferase RsmH n=1 Tax=Halorhodospira halochloris TaxID=1052 RepID=UPI0030845587
MGLAQSQNDMTDGDASSGCRDRHQPVLLGPVLAGLHIRPEGVYVDATYGRGGHARAILEKLSDQGRLIVADRDPEAVAHAQKVLGGDERCVILRVTLAELPQLLEQRGEAGIVDGLLADLGVSSPQLDSPQRGFSFQHDGPLDMRMDPQRGESAAQLLERSTAQELTRLIRSYGEERQAGRIARAIVRARESHQAPRTTRELAGLIEGVIKKREPGRHPATRTFQALRIAVNDELNELEAFLDRAIDLLRPAGRLAIIAFHSLEDRRVKRFIRDASRSGDLPPAVPVVPEGLRPRLSPVGKAYRADQVELAANRRARSAVLRIAERLP